MLYRLLILAALIFAGNVQAQSEMPVEQTISHYAGCPCRDQNKPKPQLPGMACSNEDGEENEEEGYPKPLPVACKHCKPKGQILPVACKGRCKPKAEGQILPVAACRGCKPKEEGRILPVACRECEEEHVPYACGEEEEVEPAILAVA